MHRSKTSTSFLEKIIVVFLAYFIIVVMMKLVGFTNEHINTKQNNPYFIMNIESFQNRFDWRKIM